jgi:hypothetical protein
MQFPFDINPEADAEAARLGPDHWSCVSPMSFTFWVRRDGRAYGVEGNYPGAFVDELWKEDWDFPIGDDFFLLQS